MPLRLSLLRNLFRARRLPRRPGPTSPLPQRALRCEQLEDRTVPSHVSALGSAVSIASPFDASGTTDLVTIAVKDTAGNPISGLTNGAFDLSLTAPPLPPGTVQIALFRQPSTGTFGPVTEFGTSGTYYTLFTGLLAGISRNVTVSVQGTTLSSHPSVLVAPGAVSASNSTASFAAASGLPGQSNDLTINVSDAAGNPVTNLPGSAFHFGLSAGTSGGLFGTVSEEPLVTVEETFLNSGTYTATFTGNFIGTLSTVTITVDGVQLNSQPTIGVVPVTAQNADPPSPREPFDRGTPPGNGANVGNPPTQLAPGVYVASPTNASGTPDVVTIVVKKPDGSAISDLTSGDFTLSPSGGTSTGAFGPVTQIGTSGVYTTEFTGVTAGTPLTLTVRINGTPFNRQPTIQVTPGAVSASGSTVDVVPSAGGAGSVAIGLKDAAGNAVTGRPGSVFQLSLSNGTSAGAFGSVIEKGTSGLYAAAFTGNPVGTPSALTVIVDGIQISGPPPVQMPPVTIPPVTIPPEPPPPVAPPAAPVFTGAFMFGNLMVLQGGGFPGGFAVVPLPPGCLAFFADANGDGRGDVVLFVPHLIVVLDGLSGSALAVPF